MIRNTQGWVSVMVLGIALLLTTTALAQNADLNMWAFDEVNGNIRLNTSPVHVQLVATAYDPVNEITHFVYWEHPPQTLTHRLWHRSYTWGMTMPWSNPTNIPLDDTGSLFDLEYVDDIAPNLNVPDGKTPLFVSAAVDSNGKLGVVFGWQSVHGDAGDGFTPYQKVNLFYWNSFSSTTILIDDSINNVPVFTKIRQGIDYQYILKTFRASLAFMANGYPAVVIGAGEQSGQGDAEGWIIYTEPESGGGAELVSSLSALGPVDTLTRLQIGGVSLKFETLNDTAHVAFSYRERPSEFVIHHTTVLYSSKVVGGSFLGNLEEIDLLAGYTTSPGLVRLALLNDEPHVAYEAYDSNDLKQIRISKRTNPASPYWPPYQLAHLSGGVLGELLIDSENVLERQVQIVIYASFNSFDYITMLLYEKSGIWTPDLGIGVTRFRQDIPGGGINSATGRPVVAALALVGNEDDFKIAHANNVYLDISLLLCKKPDTTPPCILDDTNDIPKPFVPTAIIMDGTTTVYSGPLDPAPGIFTSTNNWMVPKVLPSSSGYTITVTSGPNEWIHEPGFLSPYPFTLGRGDVVSIVLSMRPACYSCKIVKDGCGAAPLYVGAVVLDSFGNALLPLIPALFALGVWAVVRRRKSNS